MPNERTNESNIQRRSEPADALPSQMPGGFTMFFQKYGTRILVGITLVALAFAIIRYRSANAQRQLAAAQNSLMQARSEIMQLQELLLVPYGDPEPVALRRNQLYGQAITDLSEVQADAGDSHPALLAEYLGTQGDLYWIMANAPEYPQATTRPSLALPASPEDQLHKAELDYQQVLQRFPDQPTAWTNAQLGLAAIDENRHEWEQAARHYQAIGAQADESDAFRNIARERLMLLEQIRNPVVIGALTTRPSTTQPSTPPSTQASTQPLREPASETARQTARQTASEPPSTQASALPTTAPSSLPAR